MYIINLNDTKVHWNVDQVNKMQVFFYKTSVQMLIYKLSKITRIKKLYTFFQFKTSNVYYF